MKTCVIGKRVRATLFLSMLFAPFLFATSATAASVSYLLDQSNALPDGVDYLRVTISDSEVVAGNIDFKVEVVSSSFPAPDKNFGIQSFYFNADDELDVSKRNVVVDACGWGVDTRRNAGGGFGNFDFALTSNGNNSSGHRRGGGDDYDSDAGDHQWAIGKFKKEQGKLPGSFLEAKGPLGFAMFDSSWSPHGDDDWDDHGDCNGGGNKPPCDKRLEVLMFSISGVEGDTIYSYALGSTLRSSSGEYFAAHVAGFSDDPYGVSSGKFAGSTLVPVPPAALLFMSALAALGWRKRRTA